MKCADVRACIGESDGASWPAPVAAHLAGCPDCAAFAGSLKRVDRLLVTHMRPAVPAPDPERVRARLHASIASAGAAGGRGFWPGRARRRTKEKTMDGNRMAVRPEAVLLQPSRTYGRWATAGLVALALGVGAWTGGWVSQQRLNASVQRAASGTPVTVPGATEQVLREISLSRLKQLGLGFYNYAEDHRETAPPMDSADHAKEALLAYVDHNDVLFVSPADGHTYHTNPSVSGKPIPGIAGDPAQVVIFYEDPGPDGMRNALFLDGHAKALAPDEWVQVQRASGLAGSDH